MIRNEAIDNMLTRASVKGYLDTPVPEELLETIIACGINAPTGRNLQAPKIVAVTDPDTVRLLSKMNADIMGASGDPFYGAPCVLVVLADRSIRTYLYDGCCVMENLQLAAHALGLGACWIHRAREVFDTDEGKALLKKWGIEGDYEGIGNCIIGYPKSEKPSPKEHKADYCVYVKAGE